MNAHVTWKEASRKEADLRVGQEVSAPWMKARRAFAEASGFSLIDRGSLLRIADEVQGLRSLLVDLIRLSMGKKCVNAVIRERLAARRQILNEAFEAALAALPAEARRNVEALGRFAQSLRRHHAGHNYMPFFLLVSVIRYPRALPGIGKILAERSKALRCRFLQELRARQNLWPQHLTPSQDYWTANDEPDYTWARLNTPLPERLYYAVDAERKRERRSAKRGAPTPGSPG